VALLLGARNVSDEITIRYFNKTLLLGAENGTDGITIQYCNVALLLGGGMELMEK